MALIEHYWREKIAGNVLVPRGRCRDLLSTGQQCYFHRRNRFNRELFTLPRGEGCSSPKTFLHTPNTVPQWRSSHTYPDKVHAILSYRRLLQQLKTPVVCIKKHSFWILGRDLPPPRHAPMTIIKNVHITITSLGIRDWQQSNLCT